MALTAPTADLTGNTIADTYDQLLILDNAAGIVENTLKIVSTQLGRSALQLDDEKVLIKGVDTSNAAAFEVQQTGGTSIFKVAAGTPALTINAATVTLTQDTNFVLTGGLNGMSIDGTTFSVDGANNRVGIGTSSPSALLDVISTETTESTFRVVRDQASGSTDSPMVYFTNTNTGDDQNALIVNNDGAGDCASFNNDGSEIMVIGYAGAGNVGIGIAAPSNLLEISHNNDAVAVTAATINDNTVLGLHIAMTGDNDADGSVLKFSSSSGGCQTAIAHIQVDDTNADLAFYTENEGTLTEAMRIDDKGSVGIGVAGPTSKIEVLANQSSYWAAHFRNDGNNVNRFGIAIDAGLDSLGTDNDATWIQLQDGDGGVVAYLEYKHSGVTAEITSSSDQRLKENIIDSPVNALENINALKFRKFNWTENSRKGQDPIKIGLIAQEVPADKDICSIVSTRDEYECKDGTIIDDVKNIGWSGLIPYLAKAVQELSAKVTALENA